MIAADSPCAAKVDHINSARTLSYKFFGGARRTFCVTLRQERDVYSTVFLTES
jgi:hypothetical protein